MAAQMGCYIRHLHFTSALSDNGSNIDLLGGDSDSESLLQGGDFDRKNIFCQNSLSQPREPPEDSH